MIITFVTHQQQQQLQQESQFIEKRDLSTNIEVVQKEVVKTLSSSSESIIEPVFFLPFSLNYYCHYYFHLPQGFPV